KVRLSAPVDDKQHTPAPQPRRLLMHRPRIWAHRSRSTALALLATSVAVIASTVSASGSTTAAPTSTVKTTTPIKHVFVIIGENHTFDNVFATYSPKAGQSVLNLLSEGIVTKDGTLGPRADVASQLKAKDTVNNPGHYTLNPKVTGAYPKL